MEPFTKEFEIGYLSVKPDLYASFSKLMEYVQESSTAHTDSTIFPMSWFSENMMGWLITNWRVKVYSYPKYTDTIKVSTWPIEFKGIVGTRGFSIRDKDGNYILKAVSTWIYTDLIKRKPARPSMEMINSYGELSSGLLERDYSMPSLDSFDKVGDYNFIIRRRDIDTNYHVNNVSYLQWAQDGIPDDVYNSSNIAEMKTAYKKECSLGDNINVGTFRNNEKPEEFITIIKRIENNASETILTEIFTRWI